MYAADIIGGTDASDTIAKKDADDYVGNRAVEPETCLFCKSAALTKYSNSQHI